MGDNPAQSPSEASSNHGNQAASSPKASSPVSDPGSPVGAASTPSKGRRFFGLKKILPGSSSHKTTANINMVPPPQKKETTVVSNPVDGALKISVGSADLGVSTHTATATTTTTSTSSPTGNTNKDATNMLSSPTRYQPNAAPVGGTSENILKYFPPVTSASKAPDVISNTAMASTSKENGGKLVPNGNAIRPSSVGNDSPPSSPPPPVPESAPPASQGLPSKHSPGNQSMTSTASMVSAATVIAVDVVTHEEPRSERQQKQTLGDILHQIESKIHVLHQCQDFTTADPLPDLQYLSHQSRYSSDINVKKKLIYRMVERGIAEIFARLCRSVHSVDYLKQINLSISTEDSEESSECLASAPASKDNLPVASTSNGLDVELPPRERKDSITSRTSECPYGALGDRDRWPTASDALKNLRAAITFMSNATEKSPLLCEECIKHGLVRTMFTELSNSNLVNAEIKDQHRMYVIKGYLGILNNIIRFHNEAREIFRDSGAVKVLQLYLKSSLLMIKTKTLMLLSYVINESENDIINSSDRNLSFMIKMLQTTIESENGYSKKYGYWAVEVAAGLNRLASCESNKERIVRKGALPLYLRLIRGNCAEEQLVAAQGVWSLAFNGDNRQQFRDDSQCMQALENLAQNSPREEIKRAARGALWIIEGKGNTPRSHQVAAVTGREGAQIMISYQWSTRPVAVRIRDRLRAAGYRVWMDIDNLSGTSTEAVLEALDKAVAVMLCMTQKYKDSPSCRTEAEYSYRQRKEIIALRLQPKYNPDGWLARLVGSRMHFDFSKEENMELMMPNLVRELGARGRVRTPEPSEESRLPLGDSMLSLDPLARIATWTELDVARWLRDSDLGHVMDRFKQVNGELLLEIRKMHRNAPESFFTMLRSELAFNFISQLRFTKALDALGQS